MIRYFFGSGDICCCMRKKKNDKQKLTGRQQLEKQKEILVESLKLPKDSLLGASIVTITGNSDAFVENYRGILEYSTEEILLQGRNCQISICGKQLIIDYYTNEDMKISGQIQSIHYQ